MDARAILRKVPMFAPLSDDDCDAVLRVLKGRQGKPGDVLFREGERGESMMVVVDGMLEASVRTAGGEATLSTIGPGHVVGELAFLDAAPRAATVTAKTVTTVLELSRRALWTLCRDQPRLGAVVQRAMLADLAGRVRATEGAPAPARASTVPSSRGGRAVTAAQLRTVPSLASHTNEDLELLAYASTLRGFARGEALMEEGGEGDAAFLVVSGKVIVARSGEAGPIATLEPGALVGQLALLDRARRSATVTAATDVTALEMKKTVFGNLLNASSPLALRFQREVATAAARHLRSANARFAAGAASGSLPAQSLREMDAGDWSEGDDASIELAIDLDATRR